MSARSRTPLSSKRRSFYRWSRRLVAALLGVVALGNKPLIVLTSGRNNRDEAWRRLQADLLSRSTSSRQVLVEQAGHRIQDEQPEVIVSAIREVLESSRRW